MFAVKRWVVGALSLGVLAVAVSACGSSSGGSSSTSSKSGSSGSKPVHIAYIGYSDTTFQQAEMKGLTNIVGKNGGSVTLFNSNENPSQQASQCTDAINSGRYNAIVLEALYAQSMIPCVKAAHAQNIPVGMIEFTVGPEPFALKLEEPGEVAGVTGPLSSQVALEVQELKQACGNADPCKIIAEVASANDPFTAGTLAGVRKAMGSKLDVVGTIASEYNPATVATQMPDLLRRNPGVNAFLAISDQTAVGAVPAIAAAGLADKVKVIGLGGSAEGLAAVRSGKLFATQVDYPISWGEFIGKALQQKIDGQQVNPTTLNEYQAGNPQIATKSNLAEVKPQW